MRVSILLLTACGRIGFDEVSSTPPTRLCDTHPDALYCNDLDDGDLKGADTSDGMLVAEGADGTTGYRFVAAPGEMPRLGFDFAPTISSGAVFMSARFLLAAGPPPADFVVLAQLTSDGFIDKVSFDLIIEDRAQIANAIASNSFSTDPAVVPCARWSCFELTVIADRIGNGALALSIDDAEVLSGGAGDPTVGPDGFGRVELGTFSSSANTATTDIVFDDFVVDTSPIGCP